MKNITITLDEETAAWARVHAAERNMSLSRYVRELLRERMLRCREYEEAMKRFCAQKPIRLKRPGQRYLTREQANDRASPRRR